LTILSFICLETGLTSISQVHFYVHIKQLYYLHFYYWKITTVDYSLFISYDSQNTILAELDVIICVNTDFKVIRVVDSLSQGTTIDWNTTNRTFNSRVAKNINETFLVS